MKITCVLFSVTGISGLRVTSWAKSSAGNVDSERSAAGDESSSRDNQLSRLDFHNKQIDDTYIEAAELKNSNNEVVKSPEKVTWLDLSGNQVSKITPWVEKLPNLWSLDVSNTKVGDISAVEKLPNLTSLDVSNTKVGDISPVEKLPNLTSLNVSNTKVRDISAVGKLKHLDTLSVSNTCVKSIRSLSKHKTLQTLKLHNTSVIHVSALVGLDKLQTLELPYSQVNGICQLWHLEELTHIDLGYENATDFIKCNERLNYKSKQINLYVFDHERINQSLQKIAKTKGPTFIIHKGRNGEDVKRKDCPQKHALDFRKQQINDTYIEAAVLEIDDEVVESPEKVTHLTLSDTQVSKITPWVEKLPNLTLLDVSNTKVGDISAVGKLTKLRTLNVSNTKVGDISAVRELTNLYHLFMDETCVKDISGLVNLKNLLSLSMNDTNVDDVSAMGSGLESLTHLELPNIKVKEICALWGVKNLSILFLGFQNAHDFLNCTEGVQDKKLELFVYTDGDGKNKTLVDFAKKFAFVSVYDAFNRKTR